MFVRHWSVVLAFAFNTAACTEGEPSVSDESQDLLLDERVDQIRNDFPIPNSAGIAASWHPDGFVNLSNAFFTPQGRNGRHCGSCHAPEDGWSINPSTVERMFLSTDGTHPIFSILDADRPTADLSTVSARWNAFSMLRQGKFTRKVSPPATRDYDVIAASDPFGVGTTSSLWFFRRPLPTANFKSHTVMWDAANTVGTDLIAGLDRQARGNVTGAQQGAPASNAVIHEIVTFEAGLAHAQTFLQGVGRLDVDGGRGGPQGASEQPLVAGRFDLYDAWRTSTPKRRQVYRGQEIFNNVNVASGRRCGSCHNAANSGQNVAGTLFDVGASRPELANADMAVYTFRRRSDGALLTSTDPGRGIRSGKFADLNKFKTPSLRGLAARAPYFHNGVAADLRAVVEIYERTLGFVFTEQEKDDLVAFMSAL